MRPPHDPLPIIRAGSLALGSQIRGRNAVVDLSVEIHLASKKLHWNGV